MLIHHRGEFKPIYDIIICYEQGSCILLNQTASKIKIDQSKLFDWYLMAINWTEDIMSTIL